MSDRSVLFALLATFAFGLPASAANVDERPPHVLTSLRPAAADAFLKGKVEAALAAEMSLHGTDILVDVLDRVILLSGEVGSVDQRVTAGRLAASVSGVKKVMNEVFVLRQHATGTTLSAPGLRLNPL